MDCFASLAMTTRDWLFKTARQFADMVPRPAFDTVAGHFDNFARFVIGCRINPALGFYNLMPNVGWLWPSFLWPFFAIILALWAAVLRRRNQRA